MTAAIAGFFLSCCCLVLANSDTASGRRSLELDERSQQLVSLIRGGSALHYDAYENQNGPNDNKINGGFTNRVPDYSNAGYKGGGVPIPFVQAAVTINATSSDDTDAIQDAISTVSSLPLVDGFRGAVLLKAGNYSVSRQLTISTSGVVLRGEGSGAGGTKITYTNSKQSNMIFITGDGNPKRVGPRMRVDDAFVPSGAKSFNVTPGHGFFVGAEIIVQLTPNQAWLDDMGDMGQYGWIPSQYQIMWRRTVTAVMDNQITVDASIVQPIDSILYGGAAVYEYTLDDQTENVGIENLRLESSYSSSDPKDENHGWKAIQMMRVRNAWVRQVTGKYFGYSLVSIERYCSFITVEDSAMLEFRSLVKGGRRVSFTVVNSSFILFQRCFAQSGRRDFACGAYTPGPNAFVDNLAIDTAAGEIGPHHRYSTGQLFDSIRSVREDGSGGRIAVRNRGSLGSGHGWAGAQVMLYNCEGNIVCDAPNNAMNYAVGNIGNHTVQTKQGIWRSVDAHVSPRSLYYAQLKDRLGQNSLRHVMLPAQEAGYIWSQLDSWFGEGLFLDPLVTFLDKDRIPLKENQSMDIGGIVRDLTLLGRSPSFTWTLVSGPGDALFEDDKSLETSVSFSLAGTYMLQLDVSDSAGTAHSATLAVHVIPKPLQPTS